MKRMIFDVHLDLSMNAVEWNRDLTQPLEVIRQQEAHLTDKPDRGHNTVCFPEMHAGNVRMCVGTLIARVEHNAFSPVQGWRSQAQAWAMTQGQLAWYRAMEEAGQLTMITDSESLNRHLSQVESSSSIGFVLSLEGADSIISLEHLRRAHAQGLRAIGPAHYGPGVYTFGTDASGGFNAAGRELLKEMQRLNMILDATHLCDIAFWEVIDSYLGPIWASHSNCRELVPHNRQYSDDQIKALIKRGAVIGVALDAWMLVPNWVRRQSTPQSMGVTLDHVVDQIDHICQIAGNTQHCGIGSDLDGAFGTEQTPQDLGSIRDLQKLLDKLLDRGYTEDAVERIASGNFLRFLGNAWG